jgi:glycosyltransferase involved in cell wall biosynthesis
MTLPRSLRIALLTYRGNPHSGGQGVYVHHLSRALVELGHDVEVISGPPYPIVHDSVRLTKLPSLDLYRADDPFRTPRRDEFRDVIDVTEFAMMCTAAFPEPFTFSWRAARYLKERAEDFNIVHDNQCLGYGLTAIARRVPVIATVHHPIPIDKRLELSHAPSRKRKAALRRWYSFTRMQGRVARRLPRIITVSESARGDVNRELGVPLHRIGIVHNGVDADLFRPLEHLARVPGRIMTTASANVPLKGLVFLIEALAKLRTERDDAHLVVVGKPVTRGPVKDAIERFGMTEVVRFETEVDAMRLVELYAEAQVAVVPSLYEGFSLPAVEAMSCEVPLVVTDAGALPEVVGARAGTAISVPSGDASALAGGIAVLLDHKGEGKALGRAGRQRVLQHFTWRTAAERTVDEYQRVIERC